VPIRILLADDHAVVREGLKALLTRAGFEVVGEAADGLEAVRVCRDLRPDVAVLDLTMPSLNGLEATYEIRRDVPDTRVLLLTMHWDDHYVLKALRAGVAGYVLKSNAAEDLVAAIKQVSLGKTFLSGDVAGTVVRAYLEKGEAEADPLTPRERQVLQLVAEGKTTKEVAALLSVSIKTVESHRSNIMDKVGVRDVAGLVRYAIRRGLIQP
jgi:DNA-binding NarL/FixJ family response regulator